MKHPARLMTGLFLTALLLASGLCAGSWLKQSGWSPETLVRNVRADWAAFRSTLIHTGAKPDRVAGAPSSELAPPLPVQDETAPPADNPKAPFKTYETVQPSPGGLYRFKTVPVSAMQGMAALVILPEEEAGGISPGQAVFFYDAQRNLLPLQGSIKGVIESTGIFEGKKTLQISITGTRSDQADRIAYGDIVVAETPYAKRLPLSALQKDATDQTYIWAALTDVNGMTRVYRQYIDPGFRTEDAFDAGTKADNGRAYIIHPDSRLQEGMAILALRSPTVMPATSLENKIKFMQYDEELQRQTEAQAAETAATLQRLADKQAQAGSIDALTGARAVGGASAGACPANMSDANAMIQQMSGSAPAPDAAPAAPAAGN